jgi:nitroimidazol reductase NimA-like FMN-containing flavoprotein (pyridoxamine 5'-phosphate oxidase superfamily)
MEAAALKEKIESFIGAHNTCALATASADMVRNTPIEYNYVDEFFEMHLDDSFVSESEKEYNRL